MYRADHNGELNEEAPHYINRISCVRFVISRYCYLYVTLWRKHKGNAARTIRTLHIPFWAVQITAEMPFTKCTHSDKAANHFAHLIAPWISHLIGEMLSAMAYSTFSVFNIRCWINTRISRSVLACQLSSHDCVAAFFSAWLATKFWLRFDDFVHLHFGFNHY